MSLYTHVSFNGTPAASIKEEGQAIRNLKRLLMRRVAWLALISYTLLLFRPVMPVVTDALAHTFWEQQHLLTVHEVNGRFHVHNELVNASHQSEKDKQATGSKYATGDYMPVKMIYALQAAGEAYCKRDTYRCYTCFYPFSSPETDNPPPEA